MVGGQPRLYHSHMPWLSAQKDFRSPHRLGFCYICGRGFEAGERRNRDHVPPTSIFAKGDRTPSLILPAHPQCNERQSGDDEAIGQLISLLHGQALAPRSKLRAGLRAVPGSPVPVGLVTGIHIRRIIARWVCGFHAALYREALIGAAMRVCLPFPASSAPDPQAVQPVAADHVKLVRLLKQHRVQDLLDGIVCRGDRLRYECVWLPIKAPGGWRCVFCMDLYDWARLGDTRHYPRRGCVGYYVPDSGMPATATRGAPYPFPISNDEPLDPFAQ